MGTPLRLGLRFEWKPNSRLLLGSDLSPGCSSGPGFDEGLLSHRIGLGSIVSMGCRLVVGIRVGPIFGPALDLSHSIDESLGSGLDLEFGVIRIPVRKFNEMSVVRSCA